ncbi:MAG: hypothetical protein LC799_10145 [Actinobacteria bacterium]|nr:hypothetical protein [Actinomycetota bacterium]
MGARPVTLHVASGVPQEVVEQFLDDIRVIGLDPVLKAVPARRGLSDIAWLVLLALPLKPFFEALVQNCAGDAYLQLKYLAGKVLNRQRESGDGGRVLVLQDNTTGLQIVLESELPLEAYQQLFLVNFSGISRGPLHYDRKRGQWRAELDEWEQQNSSAPDHGHGSPWRE